MPIYEYRCTVCGERFENMTPRYDAPAPPCTTCGGAAERLPSAFAVVQAAPRTAPGPCGSTDCACRRAS